MISLSKNICFSAGSAVEFAVDVRWNIMLEQKINRFIKIYPFFAGLTGDLLFYIAIDTLFLTIVKGLSAAQIASLTSISTISCIILQFPLLWIIQKIGNTASVRLGALFLLFASVLITFGPNYYWVAVGQVLRDVAAIFNNVVFVSLENNLRVISKRDDFIRVRTSGTTTYAVITMLISFIASPLFNLNNYLPMIGCIITCSCAFLLSLFMADHSEYNIIAPQNSSGKSKFQYNKLIILAIMAYSLFFTLAQIGQGNQKLFFQQHLFLSFDVEQTSLIIGGILVLSRVTRVLGSVVFSRFYVKVKEKSGVFLTAILCASFSLSLFGSFIPHIWIKIITMGIGFTALLFVCDPFRLYLQDVVFSNTAVQYHQTLLTQLMFNMQIGKAVVSLCFTLILIDHPMRSVITIMFIMSVLCVLLSIRLYCTLMAAKRQSM